MMNSNSAHLRRGLIRLPAIALPTAYAGVMIPTLDILIVEKHRLAAAGAAKRRGIEEFGANLLSVRNASGFGEVIRPQTKAGLAPDIRNVDFVVDFRNEGEKQSLDHLDGVIEKDRQMPIQAIPLRVSSIVSGEDE